MSKIIPLDYKTSLCTNHLKKKDYPDQVKLIFEAWQSTKHESDVFRRMPLEHLGAVEVTVFGKNWKKNVK